MGGGIAQRVDVPTRLPQLSQFDHFLLLLLLLLLLPQHLPQPSALYHSLHIKHFADILFVKWSVQLLVDLQLLGFRNSRAEISNLLVVADQTVRAQPGRILNQSGCQIHCQSPTRLSATSSESSHVAVCMFRCKSGWGQHC